MKEKLTQVITILTALRDGKTIQTNMNGEWANSFINEKFEGNVALLAAYPERYRIKPEPREYWNIIMKDSGNVACSFRTKEAAEHRFTLAHYTQSELEAREIIHVKEVL